MNARSSARKRITSSGLRGLADPRAADGGENGPCGAHQSGIIVRLGITVESAAGKKSLSDVFRSNVQYLPSARFLHGSEYVSIPRKQRTAHDE